MVNTNTPFKFQGLTFNTFVFMDNCAKVAKLAENTNVTIAFS